METICYSSYDLTRKALKSNTYDLSDDSIGQYNFDNYSIDITVRRYDEENVIDFDVYQKTEVNTKYLDGGKVCNANKMPLTEHEFWKIIESRVSEFLEQNRIVEL